MGYQDETEGQSEPAATNALVGRSVHWMGHVFHSTLDGVHHSPFLFVIDHCIFFCLIIGHFSLGPDLTHSYHAHLPTLISTAPWYLVIPY